MQVTPNSTVSTGNPTTSQSSVLKSNLSNDEDTNWANFDNFNEIT